jgi:hypothetical protein
VMKREKPVPPEGNSGTVRASLPNSWCLNAPFKRTALPA